MYVLWPLPMASFKSSSWSGKTHVRGLKANALSSTRSWHVSTIREKVPLSQTSGRPMYRVAQELVRKGKRSRRSAVCITQYTVRGADGLVPPAAADGLASTSTSFHPRDSDTAENKSFEDFPVQATVFTLSPPPL